VVQRSNRGVVHRWCRRFRCIGAEAKQRWRWCRARCRGAEVLSGVMQRFRVVQVQRWCRCTRLCRGTSSAEEVQRWGRGGGTAVKQRCWCRGAEVQMHIEQRWCSGTKGWNRCETTVERCRGGAEWSLGTDSAEVDGAEVDGAEVVQR